MMLSIEAECYLPEIKCCSIYWLRDIMSGKKKVSHNPVIILQPVDRNKVRAIQVPHFEGLTKAAMLGRARKDPNVMPYLPAERDFVYLSRDWIAK